MPRRGASLTELRWNFSAPLLTAQSPPYITRKYQRLTRLLVNAEMISSRRMDERSISHVPCRQRCSYRESDPLEYDFLRHDQPAVHLDLCDPKPRDLPRLIGRTISQWRFVNERDGIENRILAGGG